MKFIWNLIVLGLLIATLVFGGPVLTTIATAWKIGDVEFILEPNNKVYIIGNGEININVVTLKKIVEVLSESSKSMKG